MSVALDAWGPWPTPREFAIPCHRDRFLASADKSETVTRGEISIQQDDNAARKIKAEDSKGDRQDSVPIGCQSPN